MTTDLLKSPRHCQFRRIKTMCLTVLNVIENPWYYPPTYILACFVEVVPGFDLRPQIITNVLDEGLISIWSLKPESAQSIISHQHCQFLRDENNINVKSHEKAKKPGQSRLPPKVSPDGPPYLCKQLPTASLTPQSSSAFLPPSLQFRNSKENNILLQIAPKPPIPKVRVSISAASLPADNNSEGASPRLNSSPSLLFAFSHLGFNSDEETPHETRLVSAVSNYLQSTHQLYD